MKKGFVSLGILLAVAATALSIWGFWLEPSSLRVREYRLEVPRWSAGLDGLRVALLADLHVGGPFNGVERLQKVVALTNAAQPDLILIPGDLVVGAIPGGELLPLDVWLPVLAQLQAPLGVHAVMGNQDAVTGVGLAPALQALGIVVLHDQAIRLERGGSAFWLAGISDLWTGPSNVGGTLSYVDDDAPVVAMSHNPDLFPGIPERVSVTFAGHTHGGQVRLPWIGAPILPSSFGQRYAAGHVVEEGRHLFVHTGIGLSLIPVRLGVPPEIAIVALHSLHAAVR